MDEYDALKDAAKAVKIELARRGMRQAELARRLDLLPGTVSRAIAGSPLDHRSKTWQRILSELDLEIIIRPKKRNPTME